jgi:hypothetical protein
MDGSTTLAKVLDKLEDKIDRQGLDALNPDRYWEKGKEEKERRGEVEEEGGREGGRERVSERASKRERERERERGERGSVCVCGRES